MKKLIIALVLVLGCALLSGCAKNYLITPMATEEQETRAFAYHQAIMGKNENGSSYAALPRVVESDEDITAYVGILNSSKEPFVFSWMDASFYLQKEGEKRIPLEYFSKDLYESRKEQEFTWQKFGAVLQAVVNQDAARRAGYSTTTGTYTGYIDNLPVSGTFYSTTYDPMKQMYAEQLANAQNQQLISQTLEQHAEKVKEALSGYLEKIYVNGTGFAGGKLMLAPLGRIETPQTLIVEVWHNQEKNRYTFLVEEAK